ncbi:hypothetical protein ASD58_08855 [Duganella sp. Root1480D1]|nr:hypothetical protein ASD58_08855 [Duganella sp. Root1480D1]
MMRKILAMAMALALACSGAQAAPLPAPARAEVDALLTRLQSSGCQFNRNGSWYSGADARTHLLRKLDYLEKKDMIKNADQFIDLGASTSSSSGKPYMVKCGTAAPVESKAWLGAELKAIRAH